MRQGGPLDPLQVARKLPAPVRFLAWRAIGYARHVFQRARLHRTVRTAVATYCQSAPSNQTAIDIFKDAWLTAFPPELGVEAGVVKHFEDDFRVPWVQERIADGLVNKTVLELGPYEAFGTWQLEKCGARSVVAIEANDVNYLKCLVVKELTGIRARFLYGDFVQYLENCRERFDVVWASGVLYHSATPLRLLRAISRVTDTIFLHTHYYADEPIRKSAHARSFFFPTHDRVERDGEFSARLHYRKYGQLKRGLFSGGPHTYSYWMEKDDVFAFLRVCGFDDIVIGVDDPGNPNGPAMFCLARRTKSIRELASAAPESARREGCTSSPRA